MHHIIQPSKIVHFLQIVEFLLKNYHNINYDVFRSQNFTYYTASLLLYKTNIPFLSVHLKLKCVFKSSSNSYLFRCKKCVFNC